MRLAPTLIFLAVFTSAVAADEARTYMSLWSSLFRDGHTTEISSPNESSGSSSSLLEGAAEAHARMVQRLTDLASQRQSQTTAGAPSRNNSDSSNGSDSSSSSILAALVPSLYNSSALEPQARSLPSWDDLASAASALLGAGNSNSSSGGSGSTSLSSSLLQRLKADLSRLDYHQLKTIALLQGLALSTMLAGRHTSGLGTDAASKHSLTGLVRGLAQESQVEDPVEASFHPAVCLGLQNFGGGEGFRAVYLGQPPCGSPNSAASDELSWGDSAAFQLHCSPLHQPPTGSTGRGGLQAPPARSLLGISDSLTQLLSSSSGERQGALKLSSLLRAAPSSGDDASIPRLSCEAAVTSDSGRGALLRYGDGRRQALQYSGTINAVQIRVCNVPPATLQSQASPPSATGSTMTLRDLQVGGMAVLAGRPLVVTQADGCVSQIYKLGSPRAVSALSGWVDLNEGSRSAGGFGVGEQASVVISLGTL